MLVEPRVVPEFRVERERNVPAMFKGNNPFLEPGKNRERRPGAGDYRCPDKYRMERLGIKPCNRKVNLERLALTAERIPVNGHVHEPEGMDPGIGYLRCHQYHTGTGGKNAAFELLYRFVQIVLVDEPGDGGGLTAGNRKSRAVRKIGRTAYFKNLGRGAVSRPFESKEERVDVFAHVPL